MTLDLLDIIADPRRLGALEGPLQGRIVRQARHAALLGYLESRSDTGSLYGKVADHLVSARVQAEYYDRQMKWETSSLEQVLGEMEGPVILLKGAAYKVLELALASGRLASDVDLLLPREQLYEAEARLHEAGWESMKADEYEQHYYREWMHELPPLRHGERGTVVDLHHNILPSTGRITLDPGRLIEDAVPVEGTCFYTLSPVDTLLHRCVHLFVDGELNNSLRELLDLHGLLCAYEHDEGFRGRLIPRAEALGLAVPLYYSVYFCQKLLKWSPPPGWIEELEGYIGPGSKFVRRMMEIQLRPGDPLDIDLKQRVAGSFLFMRSHWMRMPPVMLVKHLVRQSWHRGGVKAGGPA